MNRDADGIWVISDLMPDGAYCAVIQFGPDLTYPITIAQATEYAAQIHAASSAATYDAGVHKQLTAKLGMSSEHTAWLVDQLRKRRGQEQWEAGPMTLIPGVSAFTGEAFVRCSTACRTWQWSPRELLNHVNNVLTVATGTPNDAHYYNLLTERVGIEPDRARAVIDDLGSFLEDIDG